MDDWLGWAGVQCRIEDAYYDALVDFGFALGELPPPPAVAVGQYEGQHKLDH